MRTIFMLRDDVSIDKAADALADWIWEFSADYDHDTASLEDADAQAYEFLEQYNLHRCFK